MKLYIKRGGIYLRKEVLANPPKGFEIAGKRLVFLEEVMYNSQLLDVIY